jgi:hypothetical protein
VSSSLVSAAHFMVRVLSRRLGATSTRPVRLGRGFLRPMALRRLCAATHRLHTITTASHLHRATFQVLHRKTQKALLADSKPVPRNETVRVAMRAPARISQARRQMHKRPGDRPLTRHLIHLAEARHQPARSRVQLLAALHLSGPDRLLCLELPRLLRRSASNLPRLGCLRP